MNTIQTLPGSGSGTRDLEVRIADLEATVARQRRLLDERAVLLDEVNHRAKNNLQLGIAMLDMQARGHDDPRVSAALGEATRRLGQLARVHELLYRHSTDAQSVDMAAYLGDLTEALRLANDHRPIKFTVRCQPLLLDAGRAISLALIAGEAMSNALKHAFPDDRAGKIAVTLDADADEGRMCVTDNGVGAPVTPAPAESGKGSRGMRIIRALGRTLAAEVDFETAAGMKLTVTFPL